MAAPNKQKLTVKGLYINGKKCSKPVIEFIDAPGIAVNCIDPDGCVFEFQIPEELEGQKCFNFLVSCPDSCADCSKLITKCLCEGREDCGPCEDCIGGFCENRCEEDQFCDEDKDICVNCLPGTCKDGKVCLDGKCVCPRGSVEIDGVCLECDPETFDVICKVCIDGKVFNKDCGDGVCDPEDESCVDCITNSDCDQTKGCQQCDGKECRCCDGFVRDADGFCVPVPENPCRFNSDCSECEDCLGVDPVTGYGSCGPKDCGPNRVCVPGLGCVDRCDCSLRDCSDGGSSCADHPTLANVCYCHDCGNTPCTTEGGAECGPANDRDACICLDATCQPNPCNGKRCSHSNDCGKDCYCDNGECKPCAVLDCTDPDNSSSGCAGASAKQCGCSDSGDCEGTDECPNQFTVTKNDDCTLTANLTKDCCLCPDVTAKLSYEVTASNSYDIKPTVEYLKDGFRLDDKTAECISENEGFIGGNVRIEIENTYTTQLFEQDSNGNYVATGPIQYLPENTQSVSVGLDEITSDQSTIGSYTNFTLEGFISNGDGTFTSRDNYQTLVKVIMDPLTLKGPGCTYESQVIDEFTVDHFNVNQAILGINNRTSETLISSDDCAIPLYKWKQEGIIIRKTYVDGADTVTVDNSGAEFGGLEKLKPCKNITIESDCACKPGESDTFFCPTEDMVFVIEDSPCPKSVSANIPPICRLFGENTANLEFFVNGQSVEVRETISLQSGGSFTHTSGEVITSAEWKLYCGADQGNREACSKLQDFPKPEDQLPATAECNVNIQGSQVLSATINIPNISGVNFIDVNGAATTAGSVLSPGVITFDVSDNPSSVDILVDYLDDCGTDQTVSVVIPAADSCAIIADVIDPCDCSSRQTINGVDYFTDVIQWDVSQFEADTFEITSFEGLFGGSIVNVDGSPVTKDGLQNLAVIDAVAGTVTIPVLVSGAYSITGSVRSEDNIAIAVANPNTCSFTCECDVNTNIISPTEVCRDAKSLFFDYEATDNNGNPTTSNVTVTVEGSGVDTPNSTSEFINLPSNGQVQIPISVTSSGSYNFTVTIAAVSQDGTCTAENTEVIQVTSIGAVSCDGNCGSITNCDGTTTNCGTKIINRVCSNPVCPAGATGSEVSVLVDCTADVVNDLGQLCETITYTESAIIDCSRPINPNCGPCEQQIGSSCFPANNSECVSDSDCSSGSCVNCQCEGTVGLCNDPAACNTGNGLPCSYPANCATCDSSVPVLTCEDNSTVSNCSQCPGNNTQVGCQCFTDSNPCSISTVCAGLINDCENCDCVNNGGTAEAVITQVNDGVSCGTCGTCNSGNCTGDNETSDAFGNSCCSFNSEGCCEDSINICQGTRTCGECSSCPDINPSFSNPICSGNSYSVDISAPSPSSGCSCVLEINGNSVGAWTGGTYTYTTNDPVIGSTINAEIICS